MIYRTSEDVRGLGGFTMREQGLLPKKRGLVHENITRAFHLEQYDLKAAGFELRIASDCKFVLDTVRAALKNIYTHYRNLPQVRANLARIRTEQGRIEQDIAILVVKVNNANKQEAMRHLEHWMVSHDGLAKVLLPIAIPDPDMPIEQIVNIDVLEEWIAENTLEIAERTLERPRARKSYVFLAPPDNSEFITAHHAILAPPCAARVGA